MEVVDVDELEDAIAAAASALLDAPAIEGGQVWEADKQGGDVGGSSWIRQIDQGTFESVDFQVGASPPTGAGTTAAAREDEAEQFVNAFVVVDGAVFGGMADTPDGPTPWERNTDLDESLLRRGPWSVDLRDLAAGEVGVAPLEGEVTATRRDAAGGGTIWTLAQDQERGVTLTWHVAPAGHLHAFQIDFPGAGPEPVPRRNEIRFRPLETAPEITAPTPGDPVDLARFDVWSDLPRPD